MTEPFAPEADPAALLRALHRPGEPLLLPNVWDPGSARLVADAGFPVVATSSGAVAAALGYADGEAMPAREAFDAVRRVVAAVAVPVTADIERGYGLPPLELVRRVAGSGAVGVNLEDSAPGGGPLLDPGQQVELLAGVRSASRSIGWDLVINARVDVYVRAGGDPADLRAEAVRRARRYLAAGADCVFPIGLSDPAEIRALVEEVGGPVNVYLRAGMPGPAELAALGVARISVGSGLYQASVRRVADLVDRMAGGANPYQEAAADPGDGAGRSGTWWSRGGGTGARRR
jgi:2-methylisocitrate lyase-like PEP mutase family enzyme